MGIKSNITESALDRYFKRVEKIIKDEYLRTFAYIGETCVRKIKNREDGAGNWIDHTGNLRSSIGYVVTTFGKKQIESNFEKVLEGTEGVTEGKKLIASLVGEYTNSFALIVIAGMNYADFVEARDNKDVLANTELWARQNMQRYLERTTERIQERINNEVEL